MKQIRVYRNPNCAKCARFATVHETFDWLDRLDCTTDTPPTGPLRMGEVVVEELATGRILRGAEAVEVICHHIPAYFLLRPLFWLRSFRRYLDKELSGCGGEACEITPHNS